MDQETKTLGEVLPAVVNATTAATSPAVSTTLADFTTISLDNLPKRLTDTQLAQVEKIANLPLPKSSPCSDEQFASIMRTLDILPQRDDDRVRAEIKVKVYRRKLAQYPYHALGRMASRAIDQCKWFPTVSECLSFLSDYPTMDQCRAMREKARNVLRNERQRRMEDAMTRLEQRELDEADIARLPDEWKRIGETRGYLWRWPDGRFTVRKDTTGMSEEEREAVREENAAMFAQWDAMRAATGESEAA